MNRFSWRSWPCLVAFTLSVIVGQSAHVWGETLPARTPIDEYVHKSDESFRWKVVSRSTDSGITNVVIDMTSQTWRSPDEVDRTEWQHWIRCAIPNELRSDTAFMMIGGGKNGGKAPDGPSEMIRKIAAATGSVVFELGMVPNQPLIFHGDGTPRVEDDLIGYTWDQYLQTGDANWLARNAMVKSAVKAMDAVSEMMASDAGGNRKVDKFVVAGGSKRGWTTWLTGAIDKRVVAIVPIVIDVLNTQESMQHHFAAYGFWAPAIGNYVDHRIMERMAHPRLAAAYRIVDPYYYRHRLTLPKYVVNGSGDQFFLPDSSQFYWDELQGPKYLRYVPNADHGLDDSDAVESITAFYALTLMGKQPPQYSWSNEADGTIRVVTETPAQQVLVWQATNPHARDFRLETLGAKYTSRSLTSDDGKTYSVNVSPPKQGWTAYFIELTYDVGVDLPLKFTTGVRVTPDVLPFAGKNPTLPGTVTVVCRTKSEEQAKMFAAAVRAMVDSGKFPVQDFQSKVLGDVAYVNWKPTRGRAREEVGGLTDFAKQQGVEKINYQLEAGPEITLPPNP